MEAQRYPGDFDGIICEGPGFDWADMSLEFIDNYRSQFPEGYTKEEGILSLKNVELLEKIIFDRYDMVDGIKDGIINNPIDIIPDYTFLPKCPDGKPSDGCFTDEQINVIRTFYEGVSVKGQKIYPGFPVGRESGWYMPSLINDTGAIKLGARTWFGAFGSQIFKYLVFNDPEWDLYSYDFSNYSDDTEFAASFLSSISTDYTRYKARGGKMIIIHGLTDYSATPIRTIEYYNSVREADKDINDYIRLYLVPGMNHCVPGIGPSQVDWLKVLSDWVENEKAPERVVVSKYEKNELLMTRPLYPYPQIAVYDGKGDPNKESSFKSSAEK